MRVAAEESRRSADREGERELAAAATAGRERAEMERERKGRERGLGFVTWGGVYFKSALRVFFTKMIGFWNVFLLFVEIKISWRVYFVKILTWVGMFWVFFGISR